MKRYLHVSILVVLAMLPAQLAEQCSALSIDGLLTPKDLAEEGRAKNEPALQAGASIAQAIEHQNVTEEQVDQAVKNQDAAVVETALKENPNSAYLRFLWSAMNIASEENEDATLALLTALGVTRDAERKPLSDPELQKAARITFAEALLEVMGSYANGSPAYGRLRDIYCVNLQKLGENPTAADFLVLADLPRFNCP